MSDLPCLCGLKLADNCDCDRNDSSWIAYRYTHAEVAEALTETQALDIVTHNMDKDDSDEYAMAFIGRVVVRNVRKYVEQKRNEMRKTA